ncbi:MAG TPA: cobalamin-binding protein [Burkholderiales bacterium]|nr:cobalamin-binding protein [Burkholderiales bacterium]
MRAALLLLSLACSAAFGQIRVQDDYGGTVELAAPARRIVSLSPHLTELLYAAGAGERLVGAVEFSDYPPAAKALPRVGSDAGIDVERVLALQPDLVVAWPNVGSVRTVNQLQQLGLRVFRSEPRALEDIATTLERLAVLGGTATEGKRAAEAFRARVGALGKRYAGASRVRVFYQIWDRPLLTVNGQHVITRVVELCGGENVFAALPLLAPEVDREAVLRADPDVIVASGSGGDPPGWLAGWRQFGGLRAAARGQLYSIPPDVIQRHTPRILEGAEQLCAILERVRAGVSAR